MPRGIEIGKEEKLKYETSDKERRKERRRNEKKIGIDRRERIGEGGRCYSECVIKAL